MSEQPELRTKRRYNRLSKIDRAKLVLDVLDLDNSLEDLAIKYNITPKTMYNIARKAGVDMLLRHNILMMKKYHEDKKKQIKDLTRKFHEAALHK